MKTFITSLLLILSANCFSQIELTIDEVDEFEGYVKKMTKKSKCFKSVKTSGVLSFSVGRIDDATFYEFTITDDLGCLSEYNGKSLIKLTDGTIIEGMQLSDSNCDDVASARYLPIARDDQNNPDLMDIIQENYEKLRTIPIEKIRIYGTEHYNEYIPNPKFKEFDAKDVLIKHLQAIK